MKKPLPILGILAVIFLSPVVAAIALYWSGWFTTWSHTNHGTFAKGQVVPQLSMPLSSHWRLVYAPQRPCVDGCLREMDRLARMRLALGRRLYGLELWLALPARSGLSSVEQAALDDIGVQVMQQHGALSEPIWVLNERGEAILFYHSLDQVRDLFADLQPLSRLWQTMPS